jgi:hypothetical protein
VPNAVWPAGGGFYAPSYNSNASVWGLDCVSDSLWANHQRIYQYTAGHSETWGSTTYSIDSNAMDGIASSASESMNSIGVFRPGASNGTFFLRLHNSTGSADITIAYNPARRAYPVVGDWTGNGYDTIGVFDQSNGLFSLRNTNTAGTPNEQLVLGEPNDQPLSGHWSISSATDGVGVFRPSNGLIYLKKALSTGYGDYTMVLGIPGDIGLAGDWNGDSIDSPGVYRPSTITFYLTDQICNCSITGSYAFQYGVSGDTPVIGDWNAQGREGIGQFRQSSGYTYLKNSLTTGYADITFTYGIAGDIPVAGHWQLAYPPTSNPGSVLIPPTIAPNASQAGSAGIGD